MSKAGSHQDASITERRLRPIYDWLDAGNYKKAIQECEKVLKKTPLDRAKALKALSLLRLGKESECNEILEALSQLKPSEDGVLQAMTMCYRELQQLDKICKLYEDAVKIDPTNEELHTQLFMAYVRVFNYKQQQQTAMALYRFAPKNPYYCWAVMSIVLQAIKGDGLKDENKKKLLLSLAERMIDKLIADGKLEAEQEIQLYLIVLDHQGKYDKILEIIEGPFGAKLSGDSTINKLPYLEKVNKWNEINLLCKKYLMESMDRWNIWKYYLKSVFELNSMQNGTENHSNNIDTEEETIDDTAEKAHEFICKLVEAGAEGDSSTPYYLRGPFLARFELCKLLNEQKSGGDHVSNLVGNVMELFVEYFKKFGHKPCCVSDLRTYLNLLDQEKKLELASRLMKEVGMSSTNVPQSEQQMQSHICALELSRLCGSHLNLSLEHANALVTIFAYHYLHGQQTFGKNLLSTDQAPADAYILLVTHLLFDMYKKTESSQHLLLALVLLHNTLENSPSNFHIKLLALRIYHILGCASGAQTLYESLDIKHLQLDSLCYLHCGRLSTTGQYSLANTLFDATLKFFSSNYKDSTDHLTFSYKFGSFLKLTEFMEFRDRMNHSLNYTGTAVERMYLSFVQCNSVEQVHALEIAPRDDPVDWDQVRNNNDYNLYVSWDPERIEGAVDEWPEVKQLMEQDVALLKLRVGLLVCVQSCLQILKAPANAGEHVKRLQSELVKWEEETNCVTAKQYQEYNQRLLCMPLQSRLSIYMETPYLSILAPLLKVVIAVVSDELDKFDNNIALVIHEFKTMMSSGCEKLKKDVADIYYDRRKNLEYISNVIEIVSIACILVAICTETLKSAQANKKTKKKTTDGKVREGLVNLVSTIKSEAALMEERFKVLLDENAVESDVSELTEKVKALNLNENSEQNVTKTLQKSYETSLKEMRVALKSKLRLLNIS